METIDTAAIGAFLRELDQKIAEEEEKAALRVERLRGQIASLEDDIRDCWREARANAEPMRRQREAIIEQLVRAKSLDAAPTIIVPAANT